MVDVELLLRVCFGFAFQLRFERRFLSLSSPPLFALTIPSNGLVSFICSYLGSGASGSPLSRSHQSGTRASALESSLVQ